MTTLLARGRAALLLAAFAATAPTGCGLYESCRDGCGTSKTEYKPAADVTVPAPPGGQTALPAPAGDYQPQPGMTPAMR